MQFRWRYAKLVNVSVGGITRVCVVGVSMVCGRALCVGGCVARAGGLPPGRVV